MRLARVVPLTVALALAAVMSGAAGSQVPAALPALPTSVPMAGADFPGAPPAFEVPAGGVVEVEQNEIGPAFRLRRPDGSLFASAQVAPNGRVISAKFYDAANDLYFASYATYGGGDAEGSSGGGEAVSPSGNARQVASTTRPARPGKSKAYCGGSTWSWAGYSWWFETYYWYLVDGSVPGYLNVDTTETAMRKARTTWSYNTNYCGIADMSQLYIAYGGRIATSFGRNGISSVGFGDIGQLNCADAVACAGVWYNTRTGQIVESDHRFHTGVTWTNGRVRGKYDIQSIATHETGHSIGFDDVYDDGNVMFWNAYTHDTSNRKLGHSDADGNNTVYNTA